MLKFFISVITCLAVGFIGSFFTRGSVDSWYVHLNKPFFNPPSWVFAPVWTALYIMMGVSAFLIWRKGLDKENVRTALSIFLMQLILNLLWSPAFFGMKSPIFGLAVIIPLWLAIAWTMALFFGISRLAASLLVPYIVWVSFASILNAALFYLNR